jgi:hypothetical protein
MIFNLNLFELVEVWHKIDVTVEAETVEEAIEKVKEGDCNYNEGEELYDTQEVIRCELENEKGEVIAKWQ